LPSVLKGATTFGLLNAGDAAVRGGDAMEIAKSALFGAADSVALPLAGKAVQTVAPLLASLVQRRKRGDDPSVIAMPSFVSARPQPL
jgi:hypothetical protein